MPEIPKQPEAVRALIAQEPLRVPKDRPTKSSPKVTQPLIPKEGKISAEVALAGGFVGDVATGKGASPYLTQYLPPKKKEFTKSQVLKSAFELENTITSGVADLMNGTSLSEVEDPNFNSTDYIYNNIRETKYAPYYEQFSDVVNEDDAEKIKRKIDREEYNREVISSAGFTGLVSSLVAGVLDFVNFIPVGGGAYKAFRAGKWVKGAAQTAGAGAVGVGISESILQTQQATRTAEESLINIAGGAVLGGIIGGAAGSISAKNFSKAAKKLERDLDPIAPQKIELDSDTGTHKSLSAAAASEIEPLKKYYNEVYTKSEIEAGRDPLSFKKFATKAEGLAPVLGGKVISGARAALAKIPFLGVATEKTAKTISKLDRLTPNWRVLNAQYSAKPKEALQKINNTGMLTYKNTIGIANYQSVNAQRKTLTADFNNKGIVGVKKLFNQYLDRVKKEGSERLTRPDFETEIAKAMNYGDKHTIPEVAQAAQLYRQTIAPVVNEATSQGILKLKKFEEGKSYFPQNWNRHKVVAAEDELREILTKALQAKVIPQIKASFSKNERNLISEISDLGARRDELQSYLDKLEPKTKPTDDELALLDQWKANKKILKERPKSLFQWIKENGGIHDTGGELRAMDITTRTRPGLVRRDLTKQTSIDDVALRAWEAGYFPELRERPSPDHLLDAISRESKGDPVYSEIDFEKVEARKAAEDFFNELDKQGIDIRAIEDNKLLKTEVEGVPVDKLLIKKEIDLVQKKINRLDERMIENRQRFEGTFDEMGGEQDYLEAITDDIISNLKKERYGNTYADFAVAERGPLKHRALDFLEFDEISKFLQTDATETLKGYTRIVSTDTALSKAFDGDLTLQNTLDEIADDYTKATKKAKTPEERAAINKEKKEVIRDVEAMRDILRGIYGRPDDPDSVGTRVLQAARMLNYARFMGGVVISSMADISMPIFNHGFRRWTPVIGNIITNLKAVKMSVKEAKLAGNIVEFSTQGRLATMAEIGDPFQSGRSSFERLINNISQVQSKINLMPIWTDAHKSIASVITQNRIINASLDRGKGRISRSDLEYLSFIGIDEGMSKRIVDQTTKHGSKNRSVWIAGTEKWDDLEARNVYRNALNIDIDRTIITLNPGDIPLAMNEEFYKTVAQFKSFAFAATQQVLIAGLQRKDAAALSGAISAVALGMLTYYLKTIAAGKELSDDPKRWIIEGVDRSGFLAIMMEFNNIAEKIGRLAGKKIGLSAFTDEGVMSRYASRNITSTLAGPTFGTASDVINILAAMLKDEMSESDIHTIRTMLPYQNNFILRIIFDEMEEFLKQKAINN
jgi:hypothetical protein